MCAWQGCPPPFLCLPPSLPAKRKSQNSAKIKRGENCTRRSQGTVNALASHNSPGVARLCFLGPRFRFFGTGRGSSFLSFFRSWPTACSTALAQETAALRELQALVCLWLLKVPVAVLLNTWGVYVSYPECNAENIRLDSGTPSKSLGGMPFVFSCVAGDVQRLKGIRPGCLGVVRPSRTSAGESGTMNCIHPADFTCLSQIL